MKNIFNESRIINLEEILTHNNVSVDLSKTDYDWSSGYFNTPSMGFYWKFKSEEKILKELIGEFLTNILGLPTVHNILITYKGNLGVMSKDFNYEGKEQYSFYDILRNYYRKTIGGSILDITNEFTAHKFYQHFNLIEMYYGLSIFFKSEQKDVFFLNEVKRRLIDYFELQFLLGNIDTHEDNIQILMKGIPTLSPHFDYEESFNINWNHNPYLIQFGYDNSNYYGNGFDVEQNLRAFLQNSEREILNLFARRLKLLKNVNWNHLTLKLEREDYEPNKSLLKSIKKDFIENTNAVSEIAKNCK